MKKIVAVLAGIGCVGASHVEALTQAQHGGLNDPAALREEICLNGTWKLQVDGIAESAPVRVPGSFSGQDKLWGKDHQDVWGYPKAWDGKAAVYQRSISIPENRGNRRVLIHFGGVRHIVRVEVNGQAAGNWEDSYVPFEFDITDLVEPGENELRVHIAADKNCGLFEDYNENRRGIYRDVFLKWVPEVRVMPDAFLRTSVERKELTCQVPLRNDGGAMQRVGLRFSIEDADGSVVKSWESPTVVQLAPGEEKTTTITEAWRDPHLWSLDDPYLHHLITEVVDLDGEVLDRHRLRFGFREITWQAQKLFLNGNELYLRGHGGHTPGEVQGGMEHSRAWIQQLKDQGVELMRMHNLPRHAEMYEAADEMGFLFLAEASHHFRMPPEEKARAHMTNLIKWLRNHPSVAMWSVSNELHWRGFPEPAYLIELCNELDPSRPAFASDFSGWSLHGDVLCHHYAGDEVWSDWETYGPDKPMIYDELALVWRRDRPLKLGPAGYEIASQDVATGIWRDGAEVLKDIRVFADGKEFNDRFYRVNAYVPWNLSYSFFRFLPFNNFQRLYPEYSRIEGTEGIKQRFINPCSSTINIWDPTLPAYQPNPAFYLFRDYLERVRFPDDPKERTFFAGDEIVRTGRLFYEAHRPADRVEFRVETLDGRVLSSAGRSVSLAAGEYVPEFKSSWKMPAVDSPTPVRLVRQFGFGDTLGDRHVQEAKLFPRSRIPDLAGNHIAVVGPALRNQLGGKGVALSEAKLIVAEQWDPAWESRVRDGARALLLSNVSGSSLGGLTDSLSLDLSRRVAPGEAEVDLTQAAWKDQEAGIAFNAWSANGQPVKLRTEALQIEQPKEGSWVAVSLPGVLDLSGSHSLVLEYRMWMLRNEQNKHFGMEYLDKHVRLLLRDVKGRWVVSAPNDNVLLHQSRDYVFQDIALNLHAMQWRQAIVPGNGRQAIETGPVDVTFDFAGINGIGFLVSRSDHEEVPIQLKGFDIKGKSLPGVFLSSNGAAHRLLDGLGQEDFSFWRGGAAGRALKLPEGVNVRRILLGNKDGDGSALHEWFNGKGVVLESSLNIPDTLNSEPAASFLLGRMIDYLTQYSPGPERAPVAVIADDTLANYFTDLGLDMDRPVSGGDLADRKLIIARATTAGDLKRLSEWADDLRQAVLRGTRVMLVDVSEESIAPIRELSGLADLRLTEPFFQQRFHCIKAPVSWGRIGTPCQWTDYYDGVLVPYPFEANFSPLLSGIANRDLDWGRIPMFRNGIELEGMNPVSPSGAHNILISSWHIGSEPVPGGLYGEHLNGVRDLRQNAWFINRDPVLLEISSGDGAWLFNQLDLPAGGRKAERLMSMLLTNLGATFNGARPPVVETAYDLAPIQEQQDRFKVYEQQVDPVVRQYYGTPDPVPDYLVGTQVGKSDDVERTPTLGLLGGPNTLLLAPPLEEILQDELKMDAPFAAGESRGAAKRLAEQLAGQQWDRLVFSMGAADVKNKEISAAEFRRNLEKILPVLHQHTENLFWVPIPAGKASDPQGAARAEAFNRVARELFDGRDVYMVPFVYSDLSELPPGYFSGDTAAFSPQEAAVLARRLASAVRAFGAQGGIKSPEALPLADEAVLTAGTAVIRGGPARYMAGDDCIGGWDGRGASLSWEINVEKPGTFSLALTQARGIEGQAGFEVRIGDSVLKGQSVPTGSWTNFKTVELGTIAIDKTGVVSVTVQATDASSGIMNLRALSLTRTP